MNETNHPTNGAEKPAPLDVSVKITPSKEDGNLLAFANVTLGGCFAVTGIRVVNSEKGVFVAMPDRQNNKGEHFDVCFPTTAEMRKVLHTAVLGEYQKVMEQLASRGAQTRASVLDALKNAAKSAERPAPAPVPDRAPQQRRADRGAR